MADENPRKLLGPRHIALLGVAALAGLGLNGYREYQAKGTLDGTFFVSAAIAALLAAGVIFFVVRRGNR